MITTTALLPPISGPMSNSLLFGVAEGLAKLFPPPGVGLRDEVDEEARDETVADGERVRTTMSGRDA